jgi:hypothetical protein
MDVEREHWTIHLRQELAVTLPALPARRLPAIGWFFEIGSRRNRIVLASMQKVVGWIDEVGLLLQTPAEHRCLVRQVPTLEAPRDSSKLERDSLVMVWGPPQATAGVRAGRAAFNGTWDEQLHCLWGVLW